VDGYIAQGGTSGTVFGLRDQRKPPAVDGLQVVAAQVLSLIQDDASQMTLSAELRCRAGQEIFFNLEWRIVTRSGEPVVFGAPEIFRGERLRAQRGNSLVELCVKHLALAAGQYRIEVAATQEFRRILDTVHIPFTVETCDPGGVGFNFRYDSHWAPMFGDDHVEISPSTSSLEGLA